MVFCFLTIILFIGLFFGPSLRWGCVSRQRTVCEALGTTEPGSYGYTSLSKQPEFSSAACHLPPIETPSSTGHLQPSSCQGNHQFKNQGKVRAGEFGLAYTLWAVLLPWPRSPASPARGFLPSHNNYLKMLKFLATSGNISRSQGILCHMQFPIPHPEPVWLKFWSVLCLFFFFFLPWKS